METLIARNDQRKVALARRILKEGRLSPGGRVAVLGLAFKANTDDVRESAALTVIPALQESGLQVIAHDPKAEANARRHMKDVIWAESPYAACKGASAAIVLTEWDEYRQLNLSRLAGELSGDLLVDYRNLFDPQAVVQHGLRYISLGRSAAPADQCTGVSSLKTWDRRVAAPGHA